MLLGNLNKKFFPEIHAFFTDERPIEKKVVSAQLVLEMQLARSVIDTMKTYIAKVQPKITAQRVAGRSSQDPNIRGHAPKRGRARRDIQFLSTPPPPPPPPPFGST